MAAIEPLEREIGLVDARRTASRVSERRIPIGTVGANFEARPNVALDVAGQLLKSLNAAVLRTGGAALRTVTVLVDDVLRPALEPAGLPPGAVGLVRSPDREGARVLVSMPELDPARDPARQRRDDGRARAARRRERRAHARPRRGRRRPLRPRAGRRARRRSRSRRRASTGSASATASTSRSSTATRRTLAARAARRSSREGARGARRAATVDGARSRSTRRSATSGRATRSASRPSRSRSSTAWTRRCGSRTRRPRGSPRGSSPRTPSAAERFLDGYRGTAAFWHATTRFTDGFELTGAPETGINVDWAPGPARAGDVPRPLAAPVPRRRRRHPDAASDGRRQARARASSPGREDGPARASSAARATRDRGDRRGRASRSASSRRARSRSACRSSASSAARGRCRSCRRPRRSARRGCSRPGSAALARDGMPAAQILLTAADVADRAAYVNARNALEALFALGAVPVVNENDATATDEITFGDNDALAAQVAILVARAAARPPDRGRRRLLARARDARARSCSRGLARRRRRARRAGPQLGRGGMRSKVLAARMAAGAGIPTVIAGGRGRRRARADPRGRAARARASTPREPASSAYKLWLRFGEAGRAGGSHVDEGARRALVGRGREPARRRRRRAARAASRPGDAVELVGPDGRRSARASPARDAERAPGRPRGVEAVHRDKLVLYTEEGRGHRGRPRERARARGRARRDRARGRRPDRLLRRPDVGPAAGGDVRARPRPECPVRAGQRRPRGSRSASPRPSASSGCRSTTTRSDTRLPRRPSRTPSSSRSTASARSASAHGSPRSDEECVTPETPEERVREFSADVDEKVIVTAHIHIQFDREVAGIRSLNAGSVGLPMRRRPARTGRSSARTSSSGGPTTTSMRPRALPLQRAAERGADRRDDAHAPEQREVIEYGEERVFAG